LKTNLLKSRFAPFAVFMAGLALFLGQALVYMRQLPSTLDEGNYLYKGFLFVTGVIQPFQPYGVWTNKMPFAFLIPGTAQALFGPGLLTGRLFAIFLGLITLLALWWFVRREAGDWWAAAAVGVIAVNPGVIRMYTQALSEGVVCCLLMTAVAVGVGRGRRLWHLLVASLFFAATILTRENTLPVFGLYLIYLVFEHGWKKTLLAAVPGTVLLVIVHAVYWPLIVTNIWMPWLPKALYSLFPQLPEAQAIWDPTISLTSRLYSFWQGVRYHFVLLFGFIVLLILWPNKTGWRKTSSFRTVIFLTLTTLLMTAAHAWAALWKDYCVFCFALYLNFFSILGVALVAISAPLFRLKLPAICNSLIVLAILITGAGIGFGAHQELDDTLMKLTVPRVRGMQILPGSTELWRLLANKFGYTSEQLSQIIPAAAGLLVAVLFLLLATWLFTRLKKRLPGVSWGTFTLLAFFLLGLILSPTVVFGNPPEPDCGGDVIATTEAAGRHLASLIPPGSTVFWEGGLSPAPLLYLKDIKIFGAQLNDGYSFRRGGNSDELYRFGFWNEELSARWMDEADYLLIVDYGYRQGYDSVIDLNKFEELPITGFIATCRDYSKIHTFKRIR
jgi:4-amino-4-deoxy-L-arabinose transferase-like glycosyltransferase